MPPAAIFAAATLMPLFSADAFLSTPAADIAIAAISPFADYFALMASDDFRRHFASVYAAAEVADARYFLRLMLPDTPLIAATYAILTPDVIFTRAASEKSGNAAIADARSAKIFRA
jgi:hypothetical protein